jgi:hypothetical protein
MNFDLKQAELTLHTGDFDDDVAAETAHAVLGDEAMELAIDERPSWVNECLASALPCGGAIVVWSDPFLIIIEFGRDDTESRPDVTLGTARMVVEDVLRNLPD